MNAMRALRAGLVALCAMLPSLAAATPTLIAGRQFPRPARFADPPRPASLSGITWAGGSRYYAVADDASTGEVGLYSLTATLSSNGISVVSCDLDPTNRCVRLVGARDLEDVAFDAANGTVWAVDETCHTLREYNVRDGSIVRNLELPEILAKHRANLGLESLSLSEDGLTLWTCTEEALTCDGPRSSAATGTTVRLVKFTRPTVRGDFAFAGMYPYTTDKWEQRFDFKGQGRRGVSALCALPDGSLLVLERELSFGGSKPLLAAQTASLFYAIYQVDPCGGSKIKLFSGGGSVFTSGNHEGLCLGPVLSDGRRSVLVVSDAGDGISPAFIRPFVYGDTKD